MGRKNKGKRGRNSSTGLTPPSKMQNTNMANGSPQGQVQISQLIAQGNELIYGQQQNMNPSLNNTYHVNHVNPTSQITLSKRYENVTFSLLQRQNFTF